MCLDRKVWACDVNRERMGLESAMKGPIYTQSLDRVNLDVTIQEKNLNCTRDVMKKYYF